MLVLFLLPFSVCITTLCNIIFLTFFTLDFISNAIGWKGKRGKREREIKEMHHKNMITWWRWDAKNVFKFKSSANGMRRRWCSIFFFPSGTSMIFNLELLKPNKNKGESVRNSKCLKPYKNYDWFWRVEREERGEKRRKRREEGEFEWKERLVKNEGSSRLVVSSHNLLLLQAITGNNLPQFKERGREREKRVWGWDEILFGTFLKVFCPLALQLRLLFSSEMRLWWFSSSCLTFSLHILDSKRTSFFSSSPMKS